ncbi:hypothetical protein EDB89DRAFT_293869 [Lactarius sanguifluus]|nr:hypothetical protein EDB89DRAFT_293869 [Lactarius sanguifluus]
MSMFQSMLKDLIDGPAKSIWVRQGLPPDDIQNLYLSEAPDPSVDSSLKLGTAAQSAIGLSALAAAHFHFLRTGSGRGGPCRRSTRRFRIQQRKVLHHRWKDTKGESV